MDIPSFWNDVLAQNREKLASYFHTDATIRWHCTNECFSVNEFIRANCDYPGEWVGVIERIETNGKKITTVVNVFSKGRSISCHVVSFFLVENDRIAALDEYWADDGEIPLWRKEMQIGKPFRQVTTPR